MNMTNFLLLMNLQEHSSRNRNSAEAEDVRARAQTLKETLFRCSKAWDEIGESMADESPATLIPILERLQSALTRISSTQLEELEYKQLLLDLRTRCDAMLLRQRRELLQQELNDLDHLAALPFDERREWRSQLRKLSRDADFAELVPERLRCQLEETFSREERGVLLAAELGEKLDFALNRCKRPKWKFDGYCRLLALKPQFQALSAEYPSAFPEQLRARFDDAFRLWESKLHESARHAGYLCLMARNPDGTLNARLLASGKQIMGWIGAEMEEVSALTTLARDFRWHGSFQDILFRNAMKYMHEEEPTPERNALLDELFPAKPLPAPKPFPETARDCSSAPPIYFWVALTLAILMIAILIVALP